MTKKSFFSLVLTGVCLVMLCMLFGGVSSGAWAQQLSGMKPATATNFGHIPLYFVPNKGQVNEEVLFYAKNPDYTLWLTREGMVFDSVSRTKPRQRDVSRLVFVNAAGDIRATAENMTDHRVNYLKGRDRGQWLKGVPTSRAVRYLDVYQHIDLKVYGVQKQIEYDWIVKPGGDPASIVVAYRDIEHSAIDGQGNLVIKTANAGWTHGKPRAFQVIDGQNVEVEVAFAAQKGGKHQYGFTVGAYDKNRELVIDPLIRVYMSYLGGSGIDSVEGILVDGSGCLYAVGYTSSSNFPISGGYQGTSGGGYDGFITKFTAAGTGLVFSTYLGGSSTDAIASLVLDGSANIYVTGATSSTDFPLVNAYQSSYGGVRDVFVSKLSSNGSSLLYSTYLGGSNDDTIKSIVLTGGQVCITGSTISTDFPVYNAYDSTFGGGASEGRQDVFVTKFNSSGSALTFSTYLGGSGSDVPGGLAATSSGYIYVAGSTSSTNFPTYAGYQSSAAGMGDGFITRFTSSGSLSASTYFGGSRYDGIRDIALDGNDYIYVTGDTASTNFPTTTGAYRQTKPGGTGYSDYDIFISKFSSISSLSYSTYAGGTGGDSLPFALAVGAYGKAHITGWTESPNFPVSGAFQSYLAGGMDAFVLILSADGSSLYRSTYMGGSSTDWGHDITIDGSGYVYVGGDTWSTAFPVYLGYQMSNVGLNDGFVGKIQVN